MFLDATWDAREATVQRQVTGISISSSCTGILANLTLLMGEFDVLHRLKASLWCPKTTLRCLPMASSPMSSPIQGRRDQPPSRLFKNVLSEAHALKAAVWTQQRLCVPASGIQIGVPSHTHVDLLSVQDMPEMSLTSR